MRRVLALCLLLGSASAIAQPGTLVGTVVDAEEGRPLIGATASVGGRGVVTDASGQFSFRLDTLPARVTVRFLGYQSEILEIQASEVGRDGLVHRTIRLQPTELELGDVTVTDENAALAIMQQVIARKLALKAEITSYSAEVYTRFTLRGRGRYVRFTEELADGYWRADEGSREVVLARRRRPDGRAFRYAAPQAIPDFYFDDDVVLDGFRFPSPTHPDALSIYHFRIGDITEIDGRRLIEIAVRPQRAGAIALTGRIQIVDSLFVISEAELRPAGGVRKPAPVQNYSATYRSVFSPAADSVWLPERVYVSGRVDVGGPGARLPQVSFNQASVLEMRRINAPAPDSLFLSGDARRDANSVYSGREVFLRYRDELQLSDEEALAEQTLGPIPLRALLPPEGLLRNYVPIAVEEPPTEEERARSNATIISRLMRAPRLWYNRVDRTHVGFQPTFDVVDRLSVTPEVGVAPDTSFYTAGTAISAAVSPWLSLDAAARHGTTTRYSSTAYNRLINTVPTYLGWPDYFDYQEENRLEATVWLSAAPRIRIGLGGLFAEQTSVEATSNYEGAVTGNGQRPNPPADDGRIGAGILTVEAGTKSPRLGTQRSTFANLTLERGTLDPADQSSALTFTRVALLADAQIPTLFRRRPDPHTLTFRLLGGMALGESPAQRLGLVDGRIGPFSAQGTLRTIDLPYEGDRWGALIWSYDVGRTPFETLGLYVPVGLALHGGHAWISTANERMLPFTPRTNSDGHHELGLSFVRPLNFPIRLDLTRRLDDRGWFFSFGLAY